MAHAARPATDDLVKGFLKAVRLAAVREKSVWPSPTEVAEGKEESGSFTVAVNRQAATELTEEQLFGRCLGPATWRGISQNGERWIWDLANARLTPFARISDVKAGRSYPASAKRVLVSPKATPSQ